MIFLMLTLIVLGAASVNAQVKIGGNPETGVTTGAVLELDGESGALLLPRVDALPTAKNSAAGMQVYLTTDNKVYSYNGSVWVAGGSANADISINQALTGQVANLTAWILALTDNVPDPSRLGTLTDTRDGKVYKTAKFGTAGTWMVENLAYKPDEGGEAVDIVSYNLPNSSIDYAQYYYAPGPTIASADSSKLTVFDTKYNGGCLGYLYSWAATINATTESVEADSPLIFPSGSTPTSFDAKLGGFNGLLVGYVTDTGNPMLSRTVYWQNHKKGTVQLGTKIAPGAADEWWQGGVGYSTLASVRCKLD
jgi:hypothetical protein